MCRLDELLQIESTYVTSKQIQKQYIISTPEALLKSLPVTNLFSPHTVTSVFILDHLQVSLRSPYNTNNTQFYFFVHYKKLKCS